MEKDFWVELCKNKFEIPAGHTLAELTREIFSYVGSTDPDLRDEIGYMVFANWLQQERYPVEELRGYIKELIINLHIGIGDEESDTVFLRAFSILFLAEIVHNDNKNSMLNEADIALILEKGLWYIAAEKDPRGYIPVKGWAHALAHTADLLLVLGCNRSLREPDLCNILDSISAKMIGTTNYLYIHGEDERLASAVVEVLRRDLVPIEKVKSWALSFTEQNWKGAYTDEERNRTFQNTRNLLRSIYLELKKDEEEMPKQAELENIFLETVKHLKPY
jgi:hypothetical protein